jgi:CelD/BcsL family acetyltransferase involved in cellulose biosynthesis
VAVAEDIRKSVGVGSVAFGAVAALTPRLFLGLYGVPEEPSVRTMTRLWGTRTAVLGALVLNLDRAEDQRNLMTMAAAMNATDAALVAAARGIPARARVLGSLTSAGFAAALAYALAQ